MQNKIFIAIAAVAIIGVGGWWFLSQGAQKEVSQEQQQEEQQEMTGLNDEANDGGNNPDREEPSEGNQGGSEEIVVRATDSGYEPSSLTVSTGTKVTFVNESSRPVQTASDVHPSHLILPEFDALEGILSGQSYSFTFGKVGTWRYHNHLRPQHTGTIIVE
ncbi:MAG TPA: cupredoxin domain-containing protein [Candidatus Paceibacterota bacterium]|nr:cupredoxin domain-containing protein [Candidatus Paceibacterota bacterium]